MIEKTKTKTKTRIAYFIAFLIFMAFFILAFQFIVNRKDTKTFLFNKDYAMNNTLISDYKKEILDVIKTDKPVILLNDIDLQGDKKREKAQKIAIKNNDFLVDSFNEKKEPLLSEIMRVNKVTVSDNQIKGVKERCQNNNCYKVYKYNFFDNSTSIAFVDNKKEEVFKISKFNDMQGEISLRLKKMAQIIAIDSPEVKKLLGYSPNASEASMANVRTELRGSKCERSKHLCVAPTFLDYKKKESLWAIVDLTDLKLLGAKFTDLGGGSDYALVTERSLQNNYVTENFCEKDTYFKKGKWEGYYRLTSSDGLEIINAKFDGKKVIDSIKLVDWHVSYLEKDRHQAEGVVVNSIEESEDKGNFGYSDSTGCPLFGTSVVVSFDGPKVKDIENSDGKGFSIVQDFRNPGWPLSCNYRYENVFEFYDDGSFKVAGENRGRGCGVSGWYRPVFRIDLHTKSGKEKVEKIVSNTVIEKEKWFNPEDTMKTDKDGVAFTIKDIENGEGFAIKPDIGNFSNKGRGDNAFSYFTVKDEKRDEGVSDLVTIGPCCNKDFRQGPEKFVNNEEIKGKEVVFWYVPQVKNSDKKGEEYCWSETVVENGKPKIKSFPCLAGPIIKPI